MKAELEKALIDLGEPSWFGLEPGGDFGDPRTNLMTFGFDCGDGWYALVRSVLVYARNRRVVYENARTDWREFQANESLSKAVQEGIQEARNDYVFSHERDEEGKLLRPWEIRNPLRLMLRHVRVKVHVFRARRNAQRALFAKYPRNPFEAFRIDQVKEKYGRLCFYFSGGDEEFRSYVDHMEWLSGRICEECGTWGKRRHGAWIRTLCDAHADGRPPSLGEYENEPENLYPIAGGI